MNPIISVIAPVYNVEQYIGKSIESVLTQTFIDFELILVDDGSTDNSLDICKQYASSDKRIRVMTQDNSGPALARNKGLQLAEGSCVCFIDSDDYWDSDMLAYLYSLLQDNHCDFSICGVRHIGFPNIIDKEYDDLDYSVFTGKDAARSILLGANGFSGSACHTLFRKEVAGDLLFINTKCYEDLEFMLRVALNSKMAICSRASKYNYVYRSEGSSSTPFCEKVKDLKTVCSAMMQLVENDNPEYRVLVDTRFVSNAMAALEKEIKNNPGIRSKEIEGFIDEIKSKKIEENLLGKSDKALYTSLKIGLTPFKMTSKMLPLIKQFRR